MTKLCPRGKAAAKRKFKVYPSAYANAYASKICAGKIKDPSGVKRKDFRGPKPAGAKKGALMIIIGVGKKKKPVKASLGAAVGAISAGAGVIGASALRANKRIADKAKAEKRDIRKVEHMTGKNKNKFRDMRKKAKVQKKNTGGMPLKNPYNKGTPVYDDDKYVGNLNRRELNELQQQKRNERKNFRTTPENRRKSRVVIRKNIPIARMMGGMTAGSRSAIGRLQKARMMNKGGGADTGRVGEMKSKIGVLSNKLKRRGMRLTKRDIEKAGDLVGSTAPYIKKKNGGDVKGNVSESQMQVKSGREKAKKVIGKLKNFKNQSKGFLKEMAGFEKGGDAKIKKVIKGLHKASATHKAQAKSLQTVVGKSVGGMADYYKDII